MTEFPDTRTLYLKLKFDLRPNKPKINLFLIFLSSLKALAVGNDFFFFGLCYLIFSEKFSNKNAFDSLPFVIVFVSVFLHCKYIFML